MKHFFKDQGFQSKQTKPSNLPPLPSWAAIGVGGFLDPPITYTPENERMSP